MLSPEEIDALLNAPLQSLSEVLPTETPWQFTHTQLVDKPIIIVSFKEIKTKFGIALLAECILADGPASVLIGGEVLIDQLTKVQNKLPLRATIVHIHNYYEFA